jgi:hypothetical protein
MARLTYAEALAAIKNAPGTHQMICLDATGDSKITWDPERLVEVEAAKAQFDTLKRKGYVAYSVKGKEGAKGEIMHKFDPDAERVILAPPIAGGR